MIISKKEYEDLKWKVDYWHDRVMQKNGEIFRLKEELKKYKNKESKLKTYRIDYWLTKTLSIYGEFKGKTKEDAIAFMIEELKEISNGTLTILTSNFTVQEVE